VYPHFLLSNAPDLELVSTARRVNDAQVGAAIRTIQSVVGSLDGVPILVLGLTYREGVKELAYSRALPLIERLAFLGADVSAWDPLLSETELARCARPWRWGEPGSFRVVVTQTGDRRWSELDPGWFPDLELLLDGRNSLADLPLGEGVAYRGVGRRRPGRRGPADRPSG
jgi:UDP-N-acetyl-D-mannosaminuronate dehydrogenase